MHAAPTNTYSQTDGETLVRYWSVYEQRWHLRGIGEVQAHELATWNVAERAEYETLAEARMLAAGERDDGWPTKITQPLRRQGDEMMAAKTKDSLVQINTTCATPRLRAALKRRAIDEDTTLSALVVRYLEAGLKQSRKSSGSA